MPIVLISKPPKSQDKIIAGCHNINNIKPFFHNLKSSHPKYSDLSLLQQPHCDKQKFWADIISPATQNITSY